MILYPTGHARAILMALSDLKQGQWAGLDEVCNGVPLPTAKHVMSVLVQIKIVTGRKAKRMASRGVPAREYKLAEGVIFNE
jgi:hypothetical protein